MLTAVAAPAAGHHPAARSAHHLAGRARLGAVRTVTAVAHLGGEEGEQAHGFAALAGGAGRGGVHLGDAPHHVKSVVAGFTLELVDGHSKTVPRCLMQVMTVGSDRLRCVQSQF
jgi:hypothetical protein